MAECYRETKVPYPTQKQSAIARLKSLQEEYKTITGEYHPDFIVNEDEVTEAVKEPYKVMWTDKEGHKFSATVDAFVTAASLKEALEKSTIVRETTFERIEKK